MKPAHTLALDDWPVISSLFDQLMDLPVPERDAWLQKLPAEHAHLRRRLARMIAASEAGDAGLPDWPQYAEALTESGDAAAGDFSGGDSIGAYRLIQPLGRGGMGSVWLAESTTSNVKLPVALKLPRLGTKVTASYLKERFERERVILGALNHPNIARLYEAGVADNDQPYLALEYVNGETLIAHCNTKRLTIKGRLILFTQVLKALQYAHSNLIIHRDLKPSNILVTQTGEVKLLDFGIAKLLDTESLHAHETELTELGGRAMTPDYASPEQIRGEPLTTASDVYSAGVLLYELLTGKRPYKLKRGTRAELEEAILASDVSRPSAMVSEPIATESGNTTSRLRRTLTGDLDTIAIKALKKKPHERYATAEALQEDIERYLTGQPVHAQPDSISYRARKLLNRNRGFAAAIGAVFLALIAGLGAAVWQADTAREQARIARQETDRASSALAAMQRAETEARSALIRADKAVASAQIERDKAELSSIQLSATLDQLNESIKHSKSAEQKAIAETDNARREGAKREAETKRAEKHISSIRSLSTSLMFDIYDKLEKLQGGLELREKLANDAKGYLLELSTEVGNNPEFRLELATAFERLGDIQGRPNTRSLGQPANAIASYDEAIRLLDPILSTGGKDKVYRDSLRALAMTLRSKSQLLYQLDRLEESVASADRSVQAARALAAVPNANFEQSLIQIYSIVAAARHKAKLEKKPELLKKGIEEAISISSELRTDFPAEAGTANWLNQTDAIGYLNNELGLLAIRGPATEWEQAIEKFQIAISAREAMLAQRPNRDDTRTSLSTHYFNLAATLTKLGRYREALAQIEKSHVTSKELLLRDKNDRGTQLNIARALSSAAEIASKLKDYEAVHAYVREARDHIRTLSPEVQESELIKRTFRELLQSEKDALAQQNVNSKDETSRAASSR